MAFKLPRLPFNWRDQPMLFERYWDETLFQIEKTLNAILELPIIKQAILMAQNTADTAQQAAQDAQATADTKQNADPTLTALSGLPSTLGVVEQTSSDVFSIRQIGVASPSQLLTKGAADSLYSMSGSGVTSFNSRVGGVVLTSGDVTTALSYTPTSVTGLTGVQSVALFKTGLALVKGDVGLGNVNNTADASKAVLTATKWQTSRSFSFTGDATGSTSLDGSANVSVTLTLPTVNSNVGSFGSATAIPVITADGKGRVTAVSTAAIPTLATGMYTPTATALSNVDGATAYSAQYMRVGNMVFVAGIIDIDSTAGAAQTILGLSLPIASNLNNTVQAGGIIASSTVTASGTFEADTVNDRVTIKFIAANGTNTAYSYNFAYQIVT